ncbi:protein lingerer isoform X2 [Agrilus planipennis]|uniref:Protein lingerer isoform X2 n=1 Tax=Agrilus planipennis TaxID=224129 RepID=A0A1W4WMU6_AGRPL|nr:protein lingerer isoform X2 [Agrilus planipennis]
MSSNTKSTSKGGKGSKGETNKSNKQDKGDTGKISNDKSQHIGAGEGAKSQKSIEIDVKEKVFKLIEFTQRSEEEVCFALQQCDNDPDQAVNMLFEQGTEGEWETRSKKKKNRQASVSKGDGADVGGTGEWNENQTQSGDKDKSRNKSGGPPRLHGRNNDSRGWKGRENKENERNNTDEGGQSERRERRGRSGGPTRGGGGRGRGGGRAGGRYPPRGGNRNNNSFNNRPIDTWDNATSWNNTTVTFSSSQTNKEVWDDFPTTDDWSTEEYTGSLADTKVFTPSTQQQGDTDVGIDVASNLDANGTMQPPSIVDPSTLGSAAQQLSHAMDMHNQGTNPITSMSPTSMVGGPLNAAQTQYLSNFTQQNSETLKSVQYGNASVAAAAGPPQAQYNSGQVFVNANAAAPTAGSQPYASAPQTYGGAPQTYGGAPAQNSYGGTAYYRGTGNEHTGQAQQATTRAKTQRARVPPPSKIPSSAVEMPGDLNSSIGFLDVQFGAMDFMSDGNSFDGDKYASQNESTNSVNANANLDLSQTGQNAPSIDAYSTTKQGNQGSITSALSQNLSNTDAMPQQTSEHLTNTYNTVSRSSAQVTNAAAVGVVAPSSAPTMDINKQASDTHSYAPSSTYNSYQTKTSTAYPAQNYNSSSYNPAQTTTSSYTANQGSSSYSSGNAGSYNASSATAGYQNAYSSNSYQGNSGSSGGFPSISQANTYPAQTATAAAGNQSYQHNASQSVYGSNAGLNSTSGFGNTSSSTNQYSTYNSTSNKLKDSSYDTSNTTTPSSATNTSSSVNTTTASLSLSQTTTTGTKTATTLAKNTSSVMSNIPPGVAAPVMSTQYIMSQGIPYFQQPIYSFEDMQLLQQRIPHMTTGYYDMSYQTPTTLAAVRDGALANVAYSISDGRFTRGDNTSPVPSTLSQQTNTLTQGHQQAQPMLAQTAGPAPFFYTAAAYNPMQPTYQFGAVYPQLPTVTNAHGSNSTSQYPKPATYASGYGSGYDALSQSQEYGKGGYMSNTQGQNKGAAANSSSTGSTGNDLTAVYGKSHTALGKVNSYEKQGFHSGTPPPFTGPLHGSQNAGLAPSGTGYGPQMYIPTIAPHQQHHSTQLMHQPLHQIEVRHQNRRMESSNSSGQRSQAANQGKSGNKQYPTSYWNQA